MKNVLVACDIDNTLIHSYKHKKDDDVCIELIKEKEQGFINEAARVKIGRLNTKVNFVPITTRSVEQYLRIQWKEIIVSQYAVTTNGGILLHNGEMDALWLDESNNILLKYKNELTRVLDLLEQEDDYLRCRCVDNMYVFSYCKEGIKVDDKVKLYQEKTSLDVVSSGKKIYFLPVEFNKGYALKRLKDRFKPDYVIVAGDSEIDIPMLEVADLALCKEGIINKVCNKNKKTFTDELELVNIIMDFQ